MLMHSSRVNKNYAAVHWSFAGNACVCTIPADCMLEQNAHVHCAYERLCGSDKLGIAFFVATFFFFLMRLLRRHRLHRKARTPTWRCMPACVCERVCRVFECLVSTATASKCSVCRGHNQSRLLLYTCCMQAGMWIPDLKYLSVLLLSQFLFLVHSFSLLILFLAHQ